MAESYKHMGSVRKHSTMIGVNALVKAIRIEHPSTTQEDLVLHYTMDNVPDGRNVEIDEGKSSLLMGATISPTSTFGSSSNMNVTVDKSIHPESEIGLSMSVTIVSP